MFTKFKFKKIDDDIYERVEEEVIMEIYKVGRKYVVRLEEAMRFEEPRITRMIMTRRDDVIDFIENVFDYIDGDDDYDYE